MGLKNVGAVYAMWPDLAPLPKVLLLWMAYKSLDAPGGKDGRPPFLYFDGEASLIAAGGRSRAATYKAVKVLREEKAIEVVEAGRLRHQAVYKLRLDVLAGRAPVSQKRDPTVSRKRDPRSSENETQLGLENETPRSTGGGDEEDGEEPMSSQASVSPAPVDNSGEEPMTVEQAQRELIERYDLVPAIRLLEKHANTHPDCDNPAGHLLAGSPSFTVIPGGKSA